jgi:outer membrane protein TolC
LSVNSNQSSLPRTFGAALCALALAAPFTAPLAAETAAPAAAAVSTPATAPRKALSIDEAVAAALATDPGVISANLDALAASAKADAASWKRIPSLSASAGYTRLSELPASDTSLSFMGYNISFPSLPNVFSFGLDMQYPVFTGFRVKENIAISGLQVDAKNLARESAKRALAFDVRRAYWEAVRADYNRSTLEQNLELMRQNSELATRQLGEGVATRADELSAQMRLEQSTEDLADARALQKRAFLTLASLTGEDIAALGISTAAEDAREPFDLSTAPDDTGPAGGPAAGGSTKVDEAALVAEAIARRPETRGAELSRRLAEHGIALARSALYPTVALTGSYTYADPNQRVAFQTDPTLFTGTWALGLMLSYDIGGIPAALDDIKAQGLAAAKAGSDEVRQRNSVAMDVEDCLVALERASRALELTSSMVAQAEENLRVVQGRVAAGTAKDIDLSSARFDLLRIRFAVTNKRIDVLIARADLARATAAEDLK